MSIKLTYLVPIMIIGLCIGSGGSGGDGGDKSSNSDSSTNIGWKPATLMFGGVTDSSATVWFMVPPDNEIAEQSEVQIKCSSSPDFDIDLIEPKATTTSPEVLYTGHIPVRGLNSGTVNYVRIFVDNEDLTPQPIPHFKTFPVVADTVKVGPLADARHKRFAPAIPALAAEQPDFVIVLGDWPHWNPSHLDGMRKMHRTMRIWTPERTVGRAFKEKILRRTPVAYVWDDHDYAHNNSDKTFIRKHESIQAYNEYWPTYDRPNPDEGIWHRFDYGGLVEVFMLDLRSQRDVNSYADPRYIPDDQPGANRRSLMEVIGY